MLTTALTEYFGTGCLAVTDRYEIHLKSVPVKKSLFRPGGHQVLAVVVFHSNVLAFQEVADRILASLTTVDGTKTGKVRCTWVVCSDSGGIYLYESLATPENRGYRHMRNKFIVCNTGDGTVSFGPGNIQNRVITERMRFLLSQERLVPHAAWLREMGQLFDVCMAVIGG